MTKQFVEKVANQMPGTMLLTDTGDALAQGQDETKAGANPNPYEGMYIAGGYQAADYEKSAHWTYCKSIYEAQTGKVAPSPTAELTTMVDGKPYIDETYNTINDACQMVSTFEPDHPEDGSVRERPELGGHRRLLRQDHQLGWRSVRVAEAGQVRP